MTAEEIFAGESENIEFKSEIPAKSEKYMKTVVAFANGKGGKLVFGVDDVFNAGPDVMLFATGNGPERTLWYPIQGRAFYASLIWTF